MPRFTPEEKALLAPYVSSTEDDIFAVTGLAGIVGAVYARYSRAQGGFRETLLKEFIKEGVIDANRAQDLVERVLIAYGDDSVGELEGAHVSFENISILATKEIEDRRIGGSPIEQSTRYIFFDQKDADGNFRYYRDPAVMASPHAAAYVETMDFIFQTYCDLIEPMKAYYTGLKPIEEAVYAIRKDPNEKIRYDQCADDAERKAFRITYNADMRTKACDTLRALLPIATKTNVGIFGNGRFFQNVLTHCYTSDIPEAQDVARRAHKALDAVVPRYVKRAKRNEYVSANQARMRALTAELLANVPSGTEADDVTLIGDDAEAVAKALNSWCGGVPVYADAVRAVLANEHDLLTAAAMLYPYAQHPLRQIRDVLRKQPRSVMEKVIAAYLGDRQTRRDRPGRALETGYPYTFDLVTDFGTYKDLERHRMCTQQRQKFTPMLGFITPEDLVLAGHADRIPECVARAQALFERLLPDFPEQASYATLHGSKVRWSLGANDRALMHLIELRTTPQGHPQYRKVCQRIHDKAKERSAWRAEAMRFADHNDYFWSRADAEAKQRVKEAALERK